jgi:mono/diheme cytochrome c family protein/glucose/arabinose dehydrogenase
MLKLCRAAGVLTILALSSFMASAQDAPRSPFRDNAAWTAADGVLTATEPSTVETGLMTRGAQLDSVLTLEFKAPKGARAEVYGMGRYAVALDGTGDWVPVTIRFRGPRFDEGFTKKDNALLLEARVGAQVQRNVIYPTFSPGARWESEDFRGPAVIFVRTGPVSIRNARAEAADFEQVTVPKTSGGDTNEKQLVDTVAIGKGLFTSVGCEACHQIEPNSTAVSSGPNLYGLFRPDARQREIVEGGEGHRFTIKANREYLRHSLRVPADQLAIAEDGPTKGQAYLPVMPPFSAEILSDAQIDALGDYLATLNDPGQKGPVVRLSQLAAAAPYDPLTDGLQWLVNDEVRLQRGPLPGVSARSIHVGNPDGVNYSFDPRLLAVAKIWQGGFLDMSGELIGRGNNGLALGYESREISLGSKEYLLAPLGANGKAIDFSFKEAKWRDAATLKAALNAKEDQFDLIAAQDAQFLGYSRDSKSTTAAPVFKYRVGKNVIENSTSFDAAGSATLTVAGTLATPQTFTVNLDVLKNATVSAGKLEGDRWTLPAGKTRATLKGAISLAAKAWRPAASTLSYWTQPLQKTPATAQLPPGYSIENYYPPKDNFGRDQLFEALGLGLAKDGTLVVATRTAGIWRLKDGVWHKFAEGLFDSLGVVVEDGKGLVVVAGQKAELTRISDTNGDGIADKYDTLFDAHSYHGNYHSYMHGPVRTPDGSYYFALNLVHDGSGAAYMGGGNVMGTYGGFNGWAIRVAPSGKGELFANGLRSPASLGVGPDGRVWYTDNQGDFVGTSKMYVLEKDKFYGHPAGLVDLPGKTPSSPEIQWSAVLGRKQQPVAMFPHNRVANSPGNPAWDLTKGKFGPYAGQILIGDQTQSNLLRVVVQKVDDVEEASVMPFFEGLESGVMRPLFLKDGSLLLGQTGRGWQAKGGKVASLQHVRWDGKTVAPGIVSMQATATGFRVDLTQPLAGGVSENLLRSALSFESWTYRDAPDYGSPELDLTNDTVTRITIAKDRRSVAIDLLSVEIPKVHPVQTPRIYHVKLASATLFDVNAPAQLDAYATVRKFPAPPPPKPSR